MSVDQTTLEFCKCGHDLDSHILERYCTKCNCMDYTLKEARPVETAKLKAEKEAQKIPVRGKAWDTN